MPTEPNRNKSSHCESSVRYQEYIPTIPATQTSVLQLNLHQARSSNPKWGPPYTVLTLNSPSTHLHPPSNLPTSIIAARSILPLFAPPSSPL